MDQLPMFTSNPKIHLHSLLLLSPRWMRLRMLYRGWMDAQFVARGWELISQSLARTTMAVAIEEGTISEVEVEIDQEEGVASNATNRVTLLDNALMGIAGLLKETTGETMIMMGIEGITPQGMTALEIVLNHVLTLQNVRITANQSLALVQDPPNVALKRKVFRDLILQSTTGKLTIVVVAVEVAVLWRMQVAAVAEVEVVIRKGL